VAGAVEADIAVAAAGAAQSERAALPAVFRPAPDYPGEFAMSNIALDLGGAIMPPATLRTA
jgi:hypothetical protein